MLISSIYYINFTFAFKLRADGTHILLHFRFIFRISMVGLNWSSGGISSFWHVTVGRVTSHVSVYLLTAIKQSNPGFP